MHRLESTVETLHGHWSREYAPVLTIDPGETVRFQTLDARWLVAPGEQFAPLPEPRPVGHALTGPVYVRGAEPGMALAVHVKRLRTNNWGWNEAGGGAYGVNPLLAGMSEGERLHLDWQLDPDALVGTNQFGHTVKLRPFLGVMGVAPAEPGIHSTTPPRANGGNIDCKELVEGSTLYLPVLAPGALFSCGDGHAVQGDGEVSCLAIECGMEAAELTFDLVPNMPITMPRAKTPAGWVTFGFSENLNEAMVQALEGMLDLMGELHGLDRKTALALASLVVDLRVTQVVNQAMGVHAVLPDNAIGGL
ncbi:MAG TPA: acetamidase/formamidase family protein [Symbiobacteriaceae bacterium]|nr:acetamidase/formamidase family protein [Symbiobacteriaceae bacterium]